MCRYAKMVALYRFTSEVFDKLFHLPSLGVKHFPFNVGLFSPSEEREDERSAAYIEKL